MRRTSLQESGRAPLSMDERRCREWRLLVVMPARDELAWIRTSLDAVVRAADHARARAVVRIVIVADHCTDRTAAVARRHLGDRGTVVETCEGTAGAARAHGTALGLAPFATELASTWIASTDADTIVPGTWLTQMLDIADQGFAGAVGIVTLHPDADCDPAILRAFHSTYLIGRDGSHPHVHGANLGIRADAYLAVGGWSDQPTGEDHDLWNRLNRAGYPTLSTSELVVATSARRLARAPAGFARNLRDHDACGVSSSTRPRRPSEPRTPGTVRHR